MTVSNVIICGRIGFEYPFSCFREYATDNGNVRFFLHENSAILLKVIGNS